MKELDILSEIFESEITEDQLDEEIEEALCWDSYMIMNFMSEMNDRYGVFITIEELADIGTIRELADLVDRYERGAAGAL